MASMIWFELRITQVRMDLRFFAHTRGRQAECPPTTPSMRPSYPHPREELAQCRFVTWITPVPFASRSATSSRSASASWSQPHGAEYPCAGTTTHNRDRTGEHALTGLSVND